MQLITQMRGGCLAVMVALSLTGFKPSAARAAAGDAAAGQRVFARCAACHSTKPAANGVGPSLAGVFGRKSGTVNGFRYSAALKSAAITWDEQSLDHFLQNPAGMVHGTAMFISLPNSQDRQNVIAYLATLSPAPAQSSQR